MRPLQVDCCEHLAADREHEVVAPFDVFGDARQPSADLAKRVDVHEEIYNEHPHR
jgi:hypothetical protein